MRRTVKDTEESARKVRRRAFLMGSAMGAFVAVLGARMRFLSVEQADEFRLLAEENRVNIRLIPPNRGQIHDRNGKLIAGNEQNYRVVITREEAGDVEHVLRRLAAIVPLSEDEIARTLRESERRSSFVPIIVADRLSWTDFSKIALNAPSLPGVTPEVGLSRIYPLDTDFAHVVGYVGPVSEKDLAGMESPDPVLQIPKFQIGKIGVERWREDALRGRAGQKRIEVNHVGRVMRELGRIEGDPGDDLRLTIDAEIQNFTQVRLGEESAAVVAMDVETGDLLSIVSSPSFDPNLFVRGISQKDYSSLMENDHRPLADKTVQGVYPPGSTFKMVTALAALEAGVVGTGSGVYCPGYYELGGRRFACWKRGGHGTLSLNEALAQSCDVYFYETAVKVGIDKIAEMGRKLGLGIKHDLPMSAIAAGVMPDKAWKMESYGQEWRIGDTVNASIGQGYVLTSPLQLAVMTARLASGRSVVPRLVRGVGTDDMPIPEAPPLDIPAEYLNAARKGMYEVMNGARGTAKSSRIVDPTMVMAGKTGTAQVHSYGTGERDNKLLPWHLRDHALFVCYAPYDKPKVAVSVVVEHGGGGSAVAAPIGRDVLLRCLTGGIPPLAAYPEAQRARIETQFKEMKLRDIADPVPGRSRA
ncbi:penicillin-binding protein 2 [Gemmobacter serpentinus]|uniref:penicillin-binding protein 2 n=1 Tax=Gemmobacter serpentinus TaxID=2652247 RepID=UPI00124C873B|nr:penicillin-binding protein 2 [Gemmobacter serpentinus]